MKRNLSSQAIRAMAIGMAVTLGSATAVSGVVTGTVVNVYAANEQVDTAKATITKENTDVKITLVAKTGTFKSTNASTNKTLGFKLTDGASATFTGSKDVGSITIKQTTKANDTLEIVIPTQKLIDASFKLDGSETFKLTYVKTDTSDVQIADSGDTDLALTDLALTGNVDTVAPTLQSANAVYKSSGSIYTVEVTLTENLQDLGEQSDQNKFTIARKGVTGTENVKVTKYKFADGKLVLTLDKELKDDTYEIQYAQKDSQLKDRFNNELVLNSKVNVIVNSNPVDNIAPTITGNATYDKETKTITLTASEDLKAYDETDDSVHKFTVKKDNKEDQTITKVKVDAGEPTKIVITLQDTLVAGNYIIGYTGDVIKDKANNALGTSDTLKTFEVKADVVQGDFTATTAAGEYNFKKVGNNDNEVALVGFKAIQSRDAQTGTFENGVLTAGGKAYTLTQIGNGTKVDGLTDKALEGHTSNVTTIKENAFSGNNDVTTLAFPNVTNVETNAFSGATGLTSIDLGSASTGLTVAKDAFTGANSLKAITTSDANKTSVEAAIKGSNLQDTTTVITDENSNATNATIAKDKFYQTKEGLIFKGLSDKELSFEGKDKFTAPTKPNGLTGETKEKAYLVTYKDGVVSLKAGESTQPPVQESFDVTVQGKKLTFKPLDTTTVALVSVGAPSLFRAVAANTLQDGVLTVNGKAYNFTQIGDGTTSLGTDFDANTVLAGNLDKVTTVAKDAFNGNTTLTEISLPNVTTIAEGAFKGTSNLAKVFLGDEVVTVANGAFENTKSDIKVSSNNETTLGNLKKPGTGLDGNKVENAAPFVTSAVVNKDAANKVVVTLSEKVYAPIAITAGDFKVEGGSSLVVSSVEGLDTNKGQATDTIKLVLNKSVNAGEDLTLKYTKSGNGIKDTATQEAELADITTGFSITNNIEDSVELPAVQSATVEDANKNKIVLTLDKAPASNFEEGDKSNFTLNVNTGTTKGHAITNVESSGTTVTITLDKALAKDNTDIKLSYNGNKIKTLNDQVVTNNIGKVQAVDVTVDSVTVDGTALKITVNNAKTLKDELTLGKDGFTVTKGTANTSVDVSSAAVASNVITLTLGAAIEAGDTEIKVEYNGNNAKLVENSTNAPIAAIASQFAVNAKDATAPTLSTATASGSQQSYTITLPVSEPIKQTADPKSKFAVTVTGAASSGKTVTVDSATIDSNTKKSITLNVTTNRALDTAQDKFQVVYTKGAELVDLKDNQLDNKTIQDITITSSRVAPILAHSDSDLVVTLASVEATNGKVTVVNSFKGTDEATVKSMLTGDLTKIASGAFSGVSNMTLDFSKLSSISVIDNGAFTGASNLTIKYSGSDKEVYELAKKLENVSGVTVNDKKPSDVIKDYENNSNNGSGGGGSSSGGSGGGSGANIGTITNKDPNTEETTSQGNNNNETVVENKQLSFDVIKLPSVEGEAKVFGDVSASHWAKSYIDKLSTAGIINGSNGMFNPNGQTKRADVTIMLVNLLGLTPEANNKFVDVNASAYYAPYVGTASTYGIVNGSNGMFNPQGVISRQDTMVMIAQILKGLNLNVNADTTSLSQFYGIVNGSNGMFNPQGVISRQDTMVMIAQILKGLNLNVNADTTSLSQFGDASKVSAYANESVAILVNSGIIAGNNGKLNPTAPVTRAEMATIMSKLYDVLASANK